MKRNEIEKRMQTVLTAVVVGLLGWVGLSVSTQGTNIGVLTERVSGLQEQIQDMHDRPVILKEDFVMLTLPMIKDIKRNTDDINRLKICTEALKEDLYVKYPNPRKRVQ